MKIIQLFLDDKFADFAIEVLNNRAEVLNIVVSGNDDLKYIKSKNIIKYTTQDLSASFSDLVESYDYVFFHSLNSLFKKLILDHPKKTKYCWFLWGFDYYNEWKIETINLYEDIKSNNSKFNRLKDRIIFNDLSFSFFGDNLFRKYYKTEFREVVKMIDFVATVLPNEYYKIRKINSNVKYLPYTYGYLESYIGDKMDVDLSAKKDILVGNSADPSNNHIPILNNLSKIDLSNKKIIVPLSYAGNEAYKLKVIDYGYELLGDNFVPLVDFMPIEKYNNIIFNCGFVIFNHIRQQAIGNLIVMSYLGAKVFLNKKSVTSEFLQNYGVSYKTTDQINYKELNSSLAMEEIENNKVFYYSLFSKNAVEDKIKMMLEILEES